MTGGKEDPKMMYSRKKKTDWDSERGEESRKKTTIQKGKRHEAPATRARVRLGALKPYLTLPYLT